MKSMRPNSAAIFFMTYFYRGGGPWPPRPPPPDLLLNTNPLGMLSQYLAKFSEKSHEIEKNPRLNFDIELKNNLSKPGIPGAGAT